MSFRTTAGSTAHFRSCKKAIRWCWCSLAEAYCPKDRRQHEGLLQLHREMQVGYCRLVTISTDNLLETNEFRAGVGAHWTLMIWLAALDDFRNWLVREAA